MKNKPNMFSPWSEVTSGDRNQLVFENLNKAYGAYEIRTNYDRALIKAFSSSLLIVIFLSGLCLFLVHVNPIAVIVDKVDIQIQPPTIDQPIIVPPVLPPAPPSGQKDLHQFLQPVVSETVDQIDSFPILALVSSLNPGNSEDTTGNEPPIGPPGGGSRLIEEPETIRDAIELTEPPTFPGGDKALMDFLHEHVIYPPSVIEVGGKGIVGISFVLDKEGNVTDVTTLKGTRYPELNSEAIRVVKKLPQWTPGKQNGRAVKTRMILPIRFELKQ